MSDDSYYETFGSKEDDIKKKAKEWRKKQYQKQKEKLDLKKKQAKEKERQELRQRELEAKEDGLELDKIEFLRSHLTLAKEMTGSENTTEHDQNGDYLDDEPISVQIERKTKNNKFSLRLVK